MKKILLFTGIFLLASFSAPACEIDSPKENIHFSLSSVNRYFPEFLPKPAAFTIVEILPLKEMYSVRGGYVIDEPFQAHSFYLAYAGKLYSNFSLLRFEYPRANIFCRMENASCNRYGIMFSLHAGSARY
jgi:hypothetical protein